MCLSPGEANTNITNPLHFTNEKWFINISTSDILSSMSNLLQLSGNFCFPPGINKKNIHEFIKDFESFNRYTNDIDRIKIRNTIIPHFHRFLFRRNEQNTIENEIISLHRTTIKFRKENLNIIFTRADKGNVTVAMDREEYKTKIEGLLQDENTYSSKENPIKKLRKKFKLHNKKMMEERTHNKTNLSFLVLQRLKSSKSIWIIKNQQKKHPFSNHSFFGKYGSISHNKIYTQIIYG